MFSNFTGTTSATEASIENKATPSMLSPDSPPFVPSTMGADPPSFHLDDDLNFDLDDETGKSNDIGCEYVPQSACISAEIQSEMDEVLNEILKAHCSAMNYAAATKTMTDTISIESQRRPLARQRRDRSRDEVITDDTEERSHANDCCNDQSLSGDDRDDDDDDDLDYGDARAAAKSFGTTKVSNYYRTKPSHDAARHQRIQAVAKRSSRHPNDRNVAAQAHRLAPGQKRSAMRGGRLSCAEPVQ